MERSSDIARLVGPVSDRGSPRIRVRIAVLDILRDLVPLESPDSNVCLIPEHGVDTTSSHVERLASASLDVGEGTTGVVTGGALAFGVDGGSEEALGCRAICTLVLGSDVRVHPANGIATGVESVLVKIVRVDVFEDIDLRGKDWNHNVWTRRERNGSHLSAIWPTGAKS